MHDGCESQCDDGWPADQEATEREPLERLAGDHAFHGQLALAREHWASVPRLWLDGADCPGAARIRSSLPPYFWIGAGMPGLAHIRPVRDGRFEFAEDGLTAVIIPCYDTIPGMLDANPERHVDHLIDMIAVDLEHPDRFWRRRGEALVLGAAYLEIAGQEDEPVPVFRNPLTWLRSGGTGVVVVDWAWAPELLLGFELIAEDLALGERLESALRPEIWVVRESLNRAAS